MVRFLRNWRCVISSVPLLFLLSPLCGQEVEQYAVFEATAEAVGDQENPYASIHAQAVIEPPGGDSRTMPLFGGGGSRWRLRVGPDRPGEWSYSVSSNDPGLDGEEIDEVAELIPPDGGDWVFVLRRKG